MLRSDLNTCPKWNCWMFSCGEGRIMSTDQKGCMDRNECLDLPCLNGASCINLEPKFRYRCVCLDGFWGENCELVQEGQTLKLSMGALAAILVCLLIILSEHSLSLFLPFTLLVRIHLKIYWNIHKWLELYHTLNNTPTHTHILYYVQFYQRLILEWLWRSIR